MGGIDASHVVLIIAALAFVLTVILTAVTIGLTKKRFESEARNSKKAKTTQSVLGGGLSSVGRSTRNLQRFTTRMSMEDLVNENAVAASGAAATKSSSNNQDHGEQAPGCLGPGLPAPTDQAGRRPPETSNEGSVQSCQPSTNSVNNSNNSNDNPSLHHVSGSVLYLHKLDRPSSAVDHNEGSQVAE